MSFKKLLHSVIAHPVLTTALLSACIHFLVIVSSPVNASGGDENFFIGAALGQFRYGTLDPWPNDYLYSLNKTPGYPAMIALSFFLFGESALSIAIVQHLLYLCAQICVVVMVNSWAGRWPALLSGVFMAIDPTIQLLSQWTMSDTLSGIVVTFTWGAAVFYAYRPKLLSFFLLALCLCFSVLVRPANAVTFLPVLLFVILYWWQSQTHLNKNRVAGLAAIVVLIIGVMFSWMSYNKIRKNYFVMTDNVAWGFLDGLTQTEVFDKDAPSFAPYKARYEQMVTAPYTRYGPEIRGLVFEDITQNYTSFPPNTNELVDETLQRIAMESVKANPGLYVQEAIITLWDQLLIWDRFAASPLPRFTTPLYLSQFGAIPPQTPPPDLATLQAQIDEIRQRAVSADQSLRGGALFKAYYIISDRLLFLTRNLIMPLALLSWLVLLFKRQWLPAIGFGLVVIIALSYSMLLMMQDRYILCYLPILYGTIALGGHVLYDTVRRKTTIA